MRCVRSAACVASCRRTARCSTSPVEGAFGDAKGVAARYLGHADIGDHDIADALAATLNVDTLLRRFAAAGYRL